jgi:hypothetical protein
VQRLLQETSEEDERHLPTSLVQEAENKASEKMSDRVRLVFKFVQTEYKDLDIDERREIARILLDSTRIRGELTDELSQFEKTEKEKKVD